MISIWTGLRAAIVLSWRRWVVLTTWRRRILVVVLVVVLVVTHDVEVTWILEEKTLKEETGASAETWASNQDPTAQTYMRGQG
jgi:hypothetical protein